MGYKGASLWRVSRLARARGIKRRKSGKITTGELCSPPGNSIKLFYSARSGREGRANLWRCDQLGKSCCFLMGFRIASREEDCFRALKLEAAAVCGGWQ